LALAGLGFFFALGVKGLVLSIRLRTSSSLGLLAMTDELLTDEDAVYVAIGRALTTWAGVEDALGQVYCAAVNPRNFDPAERSYWAVVSFEGRLKMVGRAIAEREDPFSKLNKAWTPIRDDLLKQNKARNKLAHGSVVNGARWKGLLSEKQWVLAPYYHARKRPEQMERIRKMPIRPLKPVDPDDFFGGRNSVDDRPKERLNKEQLDKIRTGFEGLKTKLESFFLVVERQACAQEGVPLAAEPKNQRLTTILSSHSPARSLPQLPPTPRLSPGKEKK